MKIILRISDGKPGHDSQSIGLTNALAYLIKEDSQVYECPYLPKHLLIKIIISKLLSIKIKLTNIPEAISLILQNKENELIIIGAGHHTHLTLLILKFYCKAIAIVLMKPSLPYFLFDACIIPRHDNLSETKNIILSEGALNSINTSNHFLQIAKTNQAIILIGGNSTHFIWDQHHVMNAIITWTRHLPSNMKVVLTTSRRTPKSFLVELSTMLANNNLTQIEIISHESTPFGWIASQLLSSKYSLITEDSVSMIYEALTADVNVTLIPLVFNKGNKIANNNRYLAHNQLLNFFTANQLTDFNVYKNTRVAPKFNEAYRIAKALTLKFQLD